MLEMLMLQETIDKLVIAVERLSEECLELNKRVKKLEQEDIRYGK